MSYRTSRERERLEESEALALGTGRQRYGVKITGLRGPVTVSGSPRMSVPRKSMVEFKLPTSSSILRQLRILSLQKLGGIFIRLTIESSSRSTTMRVFRSTLGMGERRAGKSHMNRMKRSLGRRELDTENATPAFGDGRRVLLGEGEGEGDVAW
jgi:hypothetical protein